jgi:uncharacterized protein
MIKKVLLSFISFYQKRISPFLGNRCRFYPSCSDYAKEALREKKWYKALFLIGKRLLKCGPWHKGGYDPLN